MWNKLSVIIIFLLILGCSPEKENIPTENTLKIWVSSNEAEVGDEIIFKIEGNSPDNIARVNWDFGDLNKSQGKETKHTFSSPGNFRIIASIVFSNGTESKQSIDVYSFYPEVDEKKRQSLRNRINEESAIICGHRGFGKFAAENSQAAFKLAAEKGVDMIEIDVRASKDGQLVLMHDASINRTTNGEGSVSQLTYAELSSFFLYDGGTLTTEKIPSLSETLDKVRGKLYIDIDVKSSHLKETYEMVKMYGMLNQVIFTIYDSQSNKQLLNLNKELLTMPIIYEMKDLTDYMVINSNLKVAQFNSKGFTDEIINKAHEMNIAIFKNTYVNTSKTPTSDNYNEVKDFISKKGKIIQTDHPEELKIYFNSL